MSTIEMLVNQVVALAWIRCVQEEGVNFQNKKTGKIETNERVIYDSFERKLDLFDLPQAKGSKYGLEKNILEVIGGYIALTNDAQIHQMMVSSKFRALIQTKIEEIRRK